MGTNHARRSESRDACAGRALVAGLVACLVVSAAGPVRAGAGDGQPSHALFKVDAARTGFLPSGPQPPLALRWKFQTRKDESQIERYPTVDDGLSPAIVAGGVVYVGGHDGSVYALDARRGTKIWEFRTHDHVMSTPTLHDGRVFVGSMDGFYYALDAGTGAPLWKTESGYKIWNGIRYGGIRATPIITGGRIIFGC